MNILITGLTGFVGQNLIKSKYFLHHNIINFDVRKDSNFDKFNNIDVVIHMAGLAHDTKNIRNHEDYFKINTDYTKLIYDKYINSTATKFITLSSIKAVTDCSEIVIDELTIPRPKSEYGLSKLLAEKYIVNYHISDIKKYYILRPSLIYGPGIKGNLNSLFYFILKFKFWPFSNYNNKKSYCYIENLFFVINELIHNNTIKSGIYNVSDKDPISTSDIVILFSKIKHIKVLHLNLPKYLIFLLVSFSKKIKLNFISDNFNKITETNIVDNSLLTYNLNKDLPFTVRNGFEETIKQYIKNRY